MWSPARCCTSSARAELEQKARLWWVSGDQEGSSTEGGGEGDCKVDWNGQKTQDVEDIGEEGGGTRPRNLIRWKTFVTD